MGEAHKRKGEKTMSKMKKLLAMMMTAIMVMAMGMTAMAATSGDDEVFGTKDDRGTITVNGIEGNDVVVTAYPIVKANYNNSGSFSGYESLYPDIIDATFLKGDFASERATILAKLNTIIAAEKWTPDGAPSDEAEYNASYDMAVINGTATATVPVGSYLVVISNSETKIYSPVVVSVSYKNDGNGNNLTEGNVTVEDGKAWVKESPLPTIQKTIKDLVKSANDVENGENTKGNSVDIGDEVEYTVIVPAIPYFGGTHPIFNIVDTLDNGLTFKELVSVKAGGDILGADSYTFTPEGQTLTFNFVKDEYTLNNYQAQSLVIIYKATLNENATFNASPNDNGVVLNYSKDSKVEADATPTAEAVTHTYTFDISDNLVKTGEDSVKLEDAKFKLYTDESCTTELEYVNGYRENDLTTDENGKLVIKGLEAGEYWLKETQAPTGYSLNTHAYHIVIAAKGYDENTGLITGWTVTVDDTVVADYDGNGELIGGNDPDGVGSNFEKGTFEIPNTKLSSLPSTGGIGTTIFTIGGCVIMIAAAGLFFASRKKK